MITSCISKTIVVVIETYRERAVNRVRDCQFFALWSTCSCPTATPRYIDLSVPGFVWRFGHLTDPRTDQVTSYRRHNIIFLGGMPTNPLEGSCFAFLRFTHLVSRCRCAQCNTRIYPNFHCYQCCLY